MSEADRLDLHEMIAARASRLTAHTLGIALVELYSAFLQGADRSQTIGCLTHRGCTKQDAELIYDLVQGLSS